MASATDASDASLALAPVLGEHSPAPISGDNCYGWAKVSIEGRLPEIIDRVALSSGLGEGPALQTLRKEIVADAPLPPLSSDIPHHTIWNDVIDGNGTWLTYNWYFIESYFYRRLLHACNYFTTNIDPFHSQKADALSSSLPSIERILIVLKATGPRLSQTDFTTLLLMCLWGNKADLSFSPGGVDTSELRYQLDKDHDKLLIDDTLLLFNLLKSPTTDSIAIVVDNCGLDFVSDLCLMTYLCQRGVKHVTFHVKKDPIFVSDVTLSDVEFTLCLLEKESPLCQENVSLWRQWIADGTWQFKDHIHWNTFTDLPLSLKKELEGNSLVIKKGDALSRRVHSDLHWPLTTPTKSLPFVQKLNTNLVMLRTLKSETASGLSQQQLDSLCRSNGDGAANYRWLSAGEYAVIQSNLS